MVELDDNLRIGVPVICKTPRYISHGLSIRYSSLNDGNAIAIRIKAGVIVHTSSINVNFIITYCLISFSNLRYCLDYIIHSEGFSWSVTLVVKRNYK